MADVTGVRSQWPETVVDLEDLAAQLRELAGMRGRDPEMVDAGLRTTFARLAPAGAADGADPATEPVAATPMWEALVAGDAVALRWDPPPVALPPGTHPWTPERAMEPLPPLAPPGRRRHAPEPRRPRTMTLIAAVALACAVFVVAVTRLDLGTTSGPSGPPAGTPFAVSQLRTVATTDPSQAAAAGTQQHFTTGVTTVVLDIAYTGAKAGDTIEIVIRRHHAPGAGSDQVLSDRSYDLTPGSDGRGEQALTVAGPAGGLPDGQYVVSAVHHGGEVAEWSFDVGAGGLNG